MDKILVSEVELHNFRCFTFKKFVFNDPVTWIVGPNGTGKTSLFEALHYACYLRSFRATHTKDMIQLGNDSFYIKLTVHSDSELPIAHQLQVGFSGKKRVVKIDQKPVSSHKELMDFLRVVTITEDDLGLVQDGPQQRRLFLDQTIAIQDEEYAKVLKELKVAIEHKHALLNHVRIDRELYIVLTEQIKEKTAFIKHARTVMLHQIKKRIAELFLLCDEPNLEIDFSYISRLENISIDDLFQKETRYRKLLYGAHLDDIFIGFQGKSSRVYASRGQQKLTLFLMKICQIENIQKKRGPVLVLVDDFMTDFDPDRFQKVSYLLSLLNGQVIYTLPHTQKASNILIQSSSIELSY